MDEAQIDHDLEALQALAQQFIRHRDNLTKAQMDTLAGVLLNLASFYQDAAPADENRRLNDLIRLAPASIYEVDFRTRRFTLVNDRMCELSGYSREELLQMSPFDILDDSGKVLFQRRINQWLAGEKPDENVVYRVKVKDGREVYALLNVTFNTDESGRPTGATVVGVDITSWKRAELALIEATRQAEENRLILETVIEQMPAGVIVTDATGSQAKNNRAMDRIWRRAMVSTESIKEHAYRAFHADGSEYTLEEWPLTRALVDGKVTIGEEMTILRGDGTKGVIYVSAAPIRDSSGKIIAGVVIDVDITEQKRSQEELLAVEAHIEVQRRLLDQREQERLQIARDLHDGPIQDLLGAVFATQSLMVANEDPALEPQLNAVQDTLQDLIVELRTYSQELRPPALSKFGLEKAIQSHLESFKARHPNIHFHFDARPEGLHLAENVRLALYRTYQEALNNLVRHSGATEARIWLEREDNTAFLAIQDNGAGFNLPADWLELARKGHLGLVGMRERAEAVGGRMEIHTQPGKGTAVYIWAPIER